MGMHTLRYLCAHVLGGERRNELSLTVDPGLTSKCMALGHPAVTGEGFMLSAAGGEGTGWCFLIFGTLRL
jgi:hypothetical protein